MKNIFKFENFENIFFIQIFSSCGYPFVKKLTELSDRKRKKGTILKSRLVVRTTDFQLKV